MNLYISPQTSTFPLIICTIPSVLSKSCHEFTSQEKWSNPISLYQTQHASQTAKMFKCISEYTFRKTPDGYAQYRYDNTNGIPHSETHITRFPSSSADWLTVWQFKYWGKGAPEDMKRYMIMYCLKYKAQTYSISYYQQMHTLCKYIFHPIWVHGAFVVTKRL